MLPGKTFTPEDIVSILVRRRWLILLPFAVGLALVPLIAARVPQIYRSETMIMVVPQRVPDSYVRSTVTATVEDRLPSISDQILSRSRLERVIADFDLYKDLRAKAPMEDVVLRMRTDIGPVEIQRGQQSFRVSYASLDPATAQKVTARLATLFIEENSRERENLAENTNVFLESQLQDAEKRLRGQESRLEAYRRAHAGELPTQLEGNLSAIQSAQQLLQSISESINRARERRLLIQRQLADARSLPVAVTPAALGAGQQDAAALSPAQQLEQAKARLDALKLRYTPDHPDVRALERSIRDLQQKADEEAKRPPESSAMRTLSREEQDRQKLIRDLEAELEVIDHQLTTNQAEEARLRDTVADYQRKVEAVPSRESELVELSRDYDILKKSYESLLTKREDSKLSADLERRQIGEQFRILDPASLPERPANQLQRLGFIFAGAALGLALGLALTGWLEYRYSSFVRQDDVERLLSLPVLAVVPVMASEDERRSKRYRQVAVDVATSAVLVASVAVVVVWGLSQL